MQDSCSIPIAAQDAEEHGCQGDDDDKKNQMQYCAIIQSSATDSFQDMVVNVFQNKLFFIITKQPPKEKQKWICFNTDSDYRYYPFCDDFGPFNLAAVYRFCAKVRKLISTSKSDQILYYTTGDARQAANCAFLMAACVVMELGQTAESTKSWLTDLGELLAVFRDASYGTAPFEMLVADCIDGLAKAKRAGLVAFDECGFDVEEYELLDDPANGDLHVVVPDRFVAFKGPRDDAVSDSGPWADRGGLRDFHPSFYVPLFQQLGVTVVVRLNERRYDAAHFERAGIAVRDLYFDDCTAPPLGVVFRFFRAADEEAGGGAVAVHCKAGLGRTGTLIALWLMKTHHFTAREAIGWLRIARPGSVIGPQQQYLEDMQAKMWQWGALAPLQQARLVRNGVAMTPEPATALPPGRVGSVAASYAGSAESGPAELAEAAHGRPEGGPAGPALGASAVLSVAAAEMRAACGSEAEYAALAGGSPAAAVMADDLATGMERRAAARHGLSGPE